MSWKINKITLKNYKFFFGSKEIVVGENNLLVYGENGSGKSSIYEGLLKVFESRTIPQADAQSPFAAPDGESRNIYSPAIDESGIEIEFTDSAANPVPAPVTKTLSDRTINTQITPDLFFTGTVSSSDFLNYKNLSTLSDFSVESNADMFDIFVSDIFPYAQFRRGYPNPDRTPSGHTNALEWWKHTLDMLDALPKGRGRRRNQFNRTAPEYREFEYLLDQLCREIKFFCDVLGQLCTQILNDEFNIKDVEIIFDYDTQFQFNLPTARGSRHRDHTLHPFKIKLAANVRNIALPGGKKIIRNPKQFFNEAKLTCIGLALRLAVLKSKSAIGNFASCLCIDDLLLSLDMSYRMPVVRYLIKQANNYQVLMFTHDRSLYQMMQSQIKLEGQNNWTMFTMYSPNPNDVVNVRPEPIILTDEGLLAKAKALIASCDYPSAANSLRKFAEHQIKEIMPYNMWYDTDNKGNIKSRMLRQLWDQLMSTKFLDKYGFSRADFPNISQYLDKLMNPLSHDDRDVPVFRAELEACIVELEKYQPIIDRKHILVRREDVSTTDFRLQLSNGANSADITFRPIEQWDYFDSPGGRMYKKLDVEVINVTTTGTVHFTSGVKIQCQSLYTDIKNQVLHGAVGVVLPDFDQAITKVATGQTLAAM